MSCSASRCFVNSPREPVPSPVTSDIGVAGDVAVGAGPPRCRPHRGTPQGLATWALGHRPSPQDHGRCPPRSSTRYLSPRVAGSGERGRHLVLVDTPSRVLVGGPQGRCRSGGQGGLRAAAAAPGRSPSPCDGRPVPRRSPYGLHPRPRGRASAADRSAVGADRSGPWRPWGPAAVGDTVTPPAQTRGGSGRADGARPGPSCARVGARPSGWSARTVGGGASRADGVPRDRPSTGPSGERPLGRGWGGGRSRTAHRDRWNGSCWWCGWPPATLRTARRRHAAACCSLCCSTSVRAL
ncbi:hypothetical protein FB458_3046 [Lapillicoccus jejuensis]|uniref:Uncharacterized protein n=1 Tax=Lapillicoccus jejuensis TaxID=402171 RepID=A0A542E3L3_9MICO|nr:hypothetical protein FB458_3046 [Lapillicoccus jejuensis]